MPSSGLYACPYKQDSVETGRAFAAGCLIKSQGKMLAVRHRFSGKLGMPAGHAEGSESARCTAYRETLEETGLEAEVHDLLRQFDNGFRLYRCTLPGYQHLSDSVEVPVSGIAEVSEIIWHEPGSAPGRQWRFPKQHPAVMLLFDAIE